MQLERAHTQYTSVFYYLQLLTKENIFLCLIGEYETDLCGVVWILLYFVVVR